MCGLFYLDNDIWEDITRLTGGISSMILPENNSAMNLPVDSPQGNRNSKLATFPTGDIHPSESAIILTGRQGLLTAETMRWGMRGRDGNLVINARVESVMEKRMFADSVLSRRCVIPARHFYEWDREKQRVTFTWDKSRTIYMAGIYNLSENEERFTILTRAANASMSPVHDRMPLIFPEDQIKDWIFDSDRIEEKLRQGSPMLDRSQEYEQLSLFENE